MLKNTLFTIFLIAACARISCAAATFDQVKATYRPSDTIILARDGEVIQRVRTDSVVRRGQWVVLADVSPALRTALVLSEDQRFYEHSGVDWRAVSSAAWGNLWATKTRGASTISMQLAGLMDEDLKAGNSGRSIAQKISQTVATQVLEQRWRKDQILEAYLNLVPFRGEMVGIDALSRTLFDKSASGLDEREAAIAAALVRAPNAKAVQVTQRACGVLKLMQQMPAPTLVASRTSLSPEGTALARGGPSLRAAKADCEGLDVFAAAALQRKAFDASQGMAPHFARRLLAASVRPEPVEGPADKQPASSLRQAQDRPNSAPLVIRSAVRAPLQRFAVETLRQQLHELRGRHVEDGAIVVLNNATGEVLAWVGSSGELSGAADVDGVMALRQPGSTLKPFLYAQAIAERRITAASLLEDSPTNLQTAGGLYIPQNYDHQFKGLVSSRTALGASLNVPAVRTLVMVSPDAFARQLKAVGLPLKESGDYYGYSLALGSSEVSLLNLTNAYRTLANGGRTSAPSFSVRPALVEGYVTKITASTSAARTAAGQALDPRASFIVTDILADPLARARSFGTDSVLTTRFWTAVKTGTSKDMRDNWAIGFSQRYTVGVWVGNASGAPMWDVSGTSGAAPIWAAVMNMLHKTEPSRAPTPPPGVVQSRIVFGSQIEAPRSEWFMEGTENPLLATNSGAMSVEKSGSSGQKRLSNSAATPAAPPRITAPTSGTIIALDPDIPPNRQRLSFSAEGQAVRWLMDGRAFARGPQAQWLPWPGRHVVQLVDTHGTVLDEIKIEVRGAGIKAASK